jgi:hypothetical protein
MSITLTTTLNYWSRGNTGTRNGSNTNERRCLDEGSQETSPLLLESLLCDVSFAEFQVEFGKSLSDLDWKQGDV